MNKISSNKIWCGLR